MSGDLRDALARAALADDNARLGFTATWDEVDQAERDFLLDGAAHFLAVLFAHARERGATHIDVETGGLVRAESGAALMCGCPWDDEDGTPQHRASCKGPIRFYKLVPVEAPDEQ